MEEPGQHDLALTPDGPPMTAAVPATGVDARNGRDVSGTPGIGTGVGPRALDDSTIPPVAQATKPGEDPIGYRRPSVVLQVVSALIAAFSAALALMALKASLDSAAASKMSADIAAQTLAIRKDERQVLVDVLYDASAEFVSIVNRGTPVSLQDILVRYEVRYDDESPRTFVEAIKIPDNLRTLSYQGAFDFGLFARRTVRWGETWPSPKKPEGLYPKYTLVTTQEQYFVRDGTAYENPTHWMESDLVRMAEGFGNKPSLIDQGSESLVRVGAEVVLLELSVRLSSGDVIVRKFAELGPFIYQKSPGK